MTRQKLRQIVSGKNIIPGIHNYCDRWCERCPFQRRCSVFLSEEADGRTEHIENPEAQPPSLDDSLEAVKGSFALVRQMLEEDAKEMGLDWNQIVEDAKTAPPPKERKPPRFIKAAYNYALAMGKWMDQHRKTFRATGKKLAQLLLADIPGTDPLAVAEDIHDAHEVIAWYQYQIYVKFSRALGDESDDDEEQEADLTSDRNGSAKVALLGLDHTIDAWERLRGHCPALRKEIGPIIKTLARIRREGDAYFPNARAFKRPGFDDPKYADLIAQFRPAPKK